MRIEKKRYAVAGLMVLAVTLMLLLVAFKEPIEREVESGKDIRWYRDNVK